MARFEKLAAWLNLLNGWQRYFTAFAAGLVSALAMPPLDFFPILFFTLPVLVWIVDGVYGDGNTGVYTLAKRAFLPGWWFGFGYFIAGLWWIGNALLIEADSFAWALPLAVIALPAGLAIFWGLATFVARLFWSDHWHRVAVLAFALGGAEYLRGTILTGFPWNSLGYGAMTLPLTMQSASLIGLYGVTVLAIFAFSGPLVALAASGPFQRPSRKLLVASLILIAAHLVFGAWRLSTHQTQFADGVRLRLMQPGIDQALKFDGAHDAEIIERYLELSNSEPVKIQNIGKENTITGSANTLDQINYLIWPESAFPFLLTERRDVLASIGDLLPQGTQLITGAMRAESGAAGNPYGHVYNSVYLIDSDGIIQQATDKLHLLPFGEYLPFQETLESFGLEQLTRVRGGFEAGSERVIMQGAVGSPFIPLICYEVIFPGEAASPVSGFNTASNDENATKASEDSSLLKAPEWIVNVTNDGWFGLTPGPYQHHRQAVLRGVEEGLPVVRVANTGISSVSDAYGRTIISLGLGQTGVIDANLPQPASSFGNPTMFATWRNTPFLLIMGLFLLIGIIGRFRKSTF